MPDFTIKTARVIGNPSEEVWAQAHSFATVFLTIVLAKKDATSETNLAAAGKEFFVRLEHGYEASKTKNLASFREFLQDIVTTLDDVEIASLVAGMISGNVLYIASKNGAIFLKREGKRAHILKSKAELTFASGFLEDGDVIFLVSKEAEFLLESDEEKELFGSNDPQEIGEALSGAIHKMEEQEGLVALIVSAQKRSSLKAHKEKQEEDSLKEQRFPAMAFFSKSLLSKFFSHVRGRTRRVGISVFILLLILFSSSLVLGVKKRQDERANARFTAAFSAASQKYDEGIALSDLNPQLSSKTLSEAKNLLEKALPQFDKKSKEEEKLIDLEKKIEEGLKKSLHIQDFSDVPLFFDLTLIKDGAMGERMSLVSEKMLILDSKTGALYTLTISLKQAELVSGNIDEGKLEAEAQGVGFVLDKEGIERVVFKTQKREKVVDKDDEWGQIGALSSFAGNLYLLDKEKGTIYKYQATDSSFSSRRGYLGPGINPDFTQSVGMAIDGAVWVLFSDGRISKFVQGAPQSFSIQGIDVDLKDPKGIFTDDESKYLYILDKGNRRIVVVAKDGTYQAQYRWDGIKDVSDIVASEKEKKILLLSGSKIYGIDL